MALDGTTIAAIITGILALLGVLATAWTSVWNQHRSQARANKKALVRYSVSLVIAAYDLANWFYDIMEEENYAPERQAAYGEGWNSPYTSYLLGQYFAGVYILREMIQFFPHVRGKETNRLKDLLWKIQNEFCSMHYDGRESLEMRWFEGDILAVQEHMTEVVDDRGAGSGRELRTIGWVEFQKKYAPAYESSNTSSPELNKLFEKYEDGFQRIVYRRFKSLYTNRWPPEKNPQDFIKMREKFFAERVEKRLERETLREMLDGECERKICQKDALKEDSILQMKIKKLEQEDQNMKTEQCHYPNISVIIPDHRVRRLQHLLVDLVEVLDAFTAMKLKRPLRKCLMKAENDITTDNNPLDLVTGYCIPCDFSDPECNPYGLDFSHRPLPPSKGKSRSTRHKYYVQPQRTPVKQENATVEMTRVVERSEV